MSEQWVQRAAQTIHESLILRDSSGNGITGVAYTTPVVQYRADTSATWTTVTLVQGVLGTYTSGSWVEDSDGQYQLDLPSTVYGTGTAKEIYVRVSGVSGQTPTVMEFTRQLVPFNPQDQFLGLGISSAGGTGIAGVAMNLDQYGNIGGFPTQYAVDGPITASATTLTNNNTISQFPTTPYMLLNSGTSIEAVFVSSASYTGGTTTLTVQRGQLGTTAVAFTGSTVNLMPLPVISGTQAVVLPSTVPPGYATSANQATILNAVNGITTNTARSKIVIPSVLVQPTSGSAAYAINVYLYNLQGQLEDAASQTVTIAAANATGGSLDAGLSSTTMTRVSLGVYAVTYTVQSTDATGEAIFTINWTIGTDALASAVATLVEQADSLTTLLAIQSQTNKIGTNSGDSPNAVTAQGQIAALPSASANATAAAAAILVNPSQKLATNANGEVTITNPIPVPPTTTQIQAALAAGTPLPAVLSASQDFNNTGQTTPYPTSGGGGGSGSAALSFTVKSTAAGTPVIPNATVSVIDASGAAVASGVTNGSGVASGMACAPGSYTYAVYAGNFAGISGTLTPAPVAGNNPYVFSLTPNTLPIPSNPSECNVGIMIQEGAGQTGNVTITAIMTRVPPGSGNWFVGQTSTVVLVPGTQGYLTLYQNAQYSFSDGNTLIYQTIPPQTTWELPNTFS